MTLEISQNAEIMETVPEMGNTLNLKNTANFYPHGKELQELVDTTKILATCPYYQKMGPGGVLAIWLTAREMGLPPMMCLNGGMYTFSGAVSLSSQLMHQLILNAGHRIEIIKLDDNECTLKFVRGDRPNDQNSFVYTYTIEMAATAELVNKKNWKTNRRDMLFNRCMSGGGKKWLPDALMGAYAIGEMPGDDNVIDVMPKELSKKIPVKEDLDSRNEINSEQAKEIESLISQCSSNVQETVHLYIKNQIKIDCLSRMPLKQYELLKKRLEATIENEKLEAKTSIENS